MKNFSTQLDERLIKFIAPDGWIDSQNARHTLAAAGIPSPIDDSDLLRVIEQNAHFLNQFVKSSSKTQ